MAMLEEKHLWIVRSWKLALPVSKLSGLREGRRAGAAQVPAALMTITILRSNLLYLYSEKKKKSKIVIEL